MPLMMAANTSSALQAADFPNQLGGEDACKQSM
jgi:hypothetical protein